MRIGHPVEHQQQGLFDLFDDFIEAVAQRFHFDARHHALVAAAAVEAVEALGRHAHQPYAGALGRCSEILAAGIVARLI